MNETTHIEMEPTGRVLNLLSENASTTSNSNGELATVQFNPTRFQEIATLLKSNLLGSRRGPLDEW